jgi:hydrogenase maturation protease
MARLIIIGFGNPLRGDDAFGFTAAERLIQQLKDPEIEIHSLHQLWVELAEPVSRAERVVFLDASAETAHGELHRQKLEPSKTATPETFTHHLTPEVLLAAAKVIYGRAPEATLITVGATRFEFGEPMSPEVEAATESVVQELLTYR